MRYITLAPALALILWSGFYFGCDTAVDPYVGTAEPYTLWGVMNSDADTQKIRVFTWGREPGIDRPNGIDAEVSSTNLATGERIEWRHREVIYDDSATGQVFWAPFRPEHGVRYRLDVVRSDDLASSAEVTIPPPVEVELNELHTQTMVPVRITGGAPHLLGVEVRYEATNLPPRAVWPIDRKLHPLVEFPLDVSYQDELTRTDGVWEFSIMMGIDRDFVQSEYEANCLVTDGAPGIQLRSVELRFVVADSSWFPPDGVFDPEVLVNLNTFSNVENGFGFIGAGYDVRVRWTPPREVRDSLGYEQRQPCNFPDGPRPIPECMDPPIPCIGEDAQDIWDIFFPR